MSHRRGTHWPHPRCEVCGVKMVLHRQKNAWVLEFRCPERDCAEFLYVEASCPC